MIPKPERVLTLMQPYAYFVLNLPEEYRKNIENRSRSLGFFESFWISTSARCPPQYFDEACAVALRAKVPESLLPKREDLPLGAVVGKVRCAAMVKDDFRQIRGAPHYTANMTPKEFGRAIRWYFGEFGYILPEAQTIEPVPCSGKQAFWRPDAELARKLGM